MSVRHHKHWYSAAMRSLGCAPVILNSTSYALWCRRRIFRIWQVAFNRFHDQLILTGGSDGRVKLENIFSVSSAATLRVNETAEGADENVAQESDNR